MQPYPMQGASLGDFLLTPMCPLEKVTLWEGLLYFCLMLGPETNERIAKTLIPAYGKTAGLNVCILTSYGLA